MLSSPRGTQGNVTLTLMEKVLCMVVAPILYAATQVGAVKRTVTSSGFPEV